jgi:hypothetical protein
VQEREDAGRQTRQQLEDRDRADAEQLRRHDAEMESLCSARNAESLQIAVIRSRFNDLLNTIRLQQQEPSDIQLQNVGAVHPVLVQHEASSTEAAIFNSADLDQLLVQISQFQQHMAQLQIEKRQAIEAREEAERQMQKASEIVAAVQRGRDEALLKEKEAALQARRKLSPSVLPSAINFVCRYNPCLRS